MKRPSSPDQRVILKKAQKAGWVVQDTNKGWRVLSPDGTYAVVMHSSSSDTKALKAMRADFRRGGLEL